MNNNVLISNATNVSYKWIDCNEGYEPISGETNKIYTPDDNGSYALIVSNGKCIDTSACIEMNSVGIIQNDLGSDILVYPNPTTNMIEINLGTEFNNIEFVVFDAWGQQLLERRYSQLKSTRIEINGDSGLYLIRIRTEANKVALIKLIKE